ncbi:MAG: hypothetical protein U9R27_03140 [Campylobacterota bacterium]|nr:hypothetical protein [Campylobacterota bacterium]
MKFHKNFLTFTSVAILFFFYTSTSLFAYESRAIYPESEDISYNLDLDAVASLFGTSSNLEDFEWKLNDPSRQISNLDLNGDNRVDYLRVIETTKNWIHLIVIQAIIGPDLYQDVATIEVSRDRYRRTSIQIIGDPYLYGRDYIIEPSYLYVPLIYAVFWGSRYYRPYYSHYRWGYYPTRYRAWRPRSIPYYRRHIHNHIDSRNRYRYRSTARRNSHTKQMYRQIRKNDYARKYPNRSHAKRKLRRSTHRKHQNSRAVDQNRYNYKNRPRSEKPNRKSHQREIRREPKKYKRERTRERTESRQHRADRTNRAYDRTRQEKRVQKQNIQKQNRERRHQNRQNIQKRSLYKNSERGAQRRPIKKETTRRGDIERR